MTLLSKSASRCESCPCFCWSQACEVLMGANVIEKVSHLVDRILQTGWAVNLDLPDERFDTTKEAFDLVVAPGAQTGMR